MKNKKIIVAIIAISLLSLAASVLANPLIDPPPEQLDQPEQQPVGSIVYQNDKYGVSFALPATWEGYRIIDTKWEGYSLESQQSGKVTESGPIINIRHPQWTAQNPRQDIPIMIFTLAQWEALQQEQFHIGAAPIGPNELGRNSNYVFALPARYNYAFPAGHEEVNAILESKALKAY